MNKSKDDKGLTYSFDYQNAFFVFITSDRWYFGNPDDTIKIKRDWHYNKHPDWLCKDIAAAKERGIEWIIVMSHEPEILIRGHLGNALPNPGLNFTLQPILRNYGT